MKPLYFFFLLFVSALVSAQIVPEKNMVTKGQNIYCFAYSNDGKYIASSGDDKTIIIHETTSYQEIGRISGLKDIPLALCFSHNGAQIAAGGKDNRVTVFDVSSKLPVYSIKAHKEQVMSLSFSPDDQYLASASLDKMIHIWDSKTGQLKISLAGSKKSITSIDYSIDGKKIISGGADGIITSWDVNAAKAELQIEAHKSWIRKVLYSPDGSIIASCGDDKKINLWDAYSGQLLNTFLGHKNWIMNMDFSPDGNYLISGGHDLVFIVTDLRTGQMVFQSEKYDNFILGLAFNPNGQNFASSSLFSNQLKIWNTSSLGIKPMERQLAIKATSKSGLAPKISVITPKNGTSLSDASIKVQAHINSESSLRSIQLIVNGETVAVKDRSELMLASMDKGYYEFKETIVLSEGENKIQIKASNMVGETISELVSINFSAIPEILLSWINPSLMVSETNVPSNTIKASINAAKNPQQIEVLVNGINNGGIQIPAEGGLFTKEVALEPGENIISLKISTPSYSKISDIRTIIYKPADKPIITILNPLSDVVSNISGVQIKARITSQIPIDAVEIKVNGLAVYTKNWLNVSHFDLDQSLQIAPGTNKIQVFAKNRAGESYSNSRIVTFLPPEKTTISWINPSMDGDIYDAFLDLKACIQSKSNISKVEVFNNDAILLTETQFQDQTTTECTVDFNKKISLAPGTNKLRISATNVAGVTHSEIRIMNYTIPQLATIQWLDPQNFQITTSENSLSIKTCINTNTPLQSISLLLNGQVIATEENPIKNLSGCSYPYNQTVPLQKGNNMVLIKAKNRAGEAISSPILAEYKSSNPYRFALIIGNEDYSSYQSGLNSESDVDFALNDARAFKAMCQKTLGIKEDNIIYLENARYTDMMKNIKKISGIIEVTKGKAEIIVFYAGHGFPDEKSKEPYLVPVDGSGSDIDITGVKLTYFYEQLTTAPAQRITVFLDACFSGGARNQGLIAARGVKIVPKAAPEAVKKNLVVFSASSGDQSSLPYTEKQHGMFSYFVLNKINETNGNVTYKELSDFITEQVSIKSFMVNSKQQEPQINVSPEVENEWQNWRFSE